MKKMRKTRILKLIMKQLGVKKGEHFQFADQREEFVEYYFTDEAMIRIDMSEYMEKSQELL